MGLWSEETEHVLTETFRRLVLDALVREERRTTPRASPNGSGSSSAGAGRRRSGWTDGEASPPAPPPAEATDGACVRSLLTDLENSLAPHPDTGEVPELKRPASLRALAELDLADLPRLRDLRGNPAPDPKDWAFEFAARRLAERGDDPGVTWVAVRGPGWGSPTTVHALAALVERDPTPAGMALLRAALDAWTEAMATQPDPGQLYGKGTIPSPVLDVRTRPFAIAALERGVRMFGDPGYSAARDLQMKRLRETLGEGGQLEAIRSGRIPGGLERPYLTDRDDALFTVAVYGFACAFAGDRPGHEETKGWIRDALRREGGEGGPFSCYRAASVEDRLDLLGVMRGRAGWLEPPR